MPWTRNYPIVIASGVAVLLFSLVGVAAISGVLPKDVAKHNPHATPFLESTASAAAAKKANCRHCGVIKALRAVHVQGEAGKGAHKRKVYRVTVRMDDGTERILSFVDEPAYGVGSRVKVNGNALERG